GLVPLHGSRGRRLDVVPARGPLRAEVHPRPRQVRSGPEARIQHRELPRHDAGHVLVLDGHLSARGDRHDRENARHEAEGAKAQGHVNLQGGGSNERTRGPRRGQWPHRGTRNVYLPMSSRTSGPPRPPVSGHTGPTKVVRSEPGQPGTSGWTSSGSASTRSWRRSAGAPWVGSTRPTTLY